MPISRDQHGQPAGVRCRPGRLPGSGPVSQGIHFCSCRPCQPSSWDRPSSRSLHQPQQSSCPGQPGVQVACESASKTDMVMIFGEITTSAKVDYEKVVRDTCRQIGFTSKDVGLDADTCQVPCSLCMPHSCGHCCSMSWVLCSMPMACASGAELDPADQASTAGAGAHRGAVPRDWRWGARHGHQGA